MSKKQMVLGARSLGMAAVVTVLLVAVAGPVAAQVPDPAPDASLPGGSLITQVLGWLKYASLAAAVSGLLIGGIATGVGHFGANYSASSAGRKWLLGGIGLVFTCVGAGVDIVIREHRIAVELLADLVDKLHAGELQKPYRLLQLRSHYKLLALS